MHEHEAGTLEPQLTAAAALTLSLLLAAYVPRAAAAEDDGEAAYNNACRTCHSAKPGDNRLGPHLNGIVVVGRKAGSAEGFAYSQAMKNAGVTWDETSLDKFIANPEAVVQGNNMKPYTGIQYAAQRKAIIEFLRKP